jgi:hypothetical protein
MPKKLRVYLDLELSEEDPEGRKAAELLKGTSKDMIYLSVGPAELEVSDLHVHGLVD